MTSVWRIRAGRQARHAMRFYAGGFVALNWRRVGASVEGMPKDAIRHLAEQHLPSGSARWAASQLHRLANDVDIGDLVVVPFDTRVDLLVGEVTGNYYYKEDPLLPPDDVFAHRVPVRWLGVNDKERVRVEALGSFNTEVSLVGLPNAEDVRAAMTTGLDDPRTLT